MTTSQFAHPIIVRDATAEDLPAIQRIYAHHVLHGYASFEEVPPEAEEMARRFADVRSRGLPYLAAELGGTVRGYAYAGPFRPRSAYRHTVEDSVYVDHALTGRGLGRALLRALIARCSALGYRQMIAVIGRHGESRSVRAHAALGFLQSGELKSVGFKHGRWVDIVIMQRALGPGDTRLPG